MVVRQEAVPQRVEIGIRSAHRPRPERHAARADRAARVDDGELRIVLPFSGCERSHPSQKRLTARAADVAKHGDLAAVLDVAQRTQHRDCRRHFRGAERCEPRLPANDRTRHRQRSRHRATNVGRCDVRGRRWRASEPLPQPPFQRVDRFHAGELQSRGGLRTGNDRAAAHQRIARAYEQRGGRRRAIEHEHRADDFVESGQILEVGGLRESELIIGKERSAGRNNQQVFSNRL